LGFDAHGQRRDVPYRNDRADALVMFGLTGDLGDKKLFPALHELAAAGKLGVPVIGVGRSEHNDDDLRSMFRDALGESYHPDVADSIDLSYVSGDSTDAATYDDLASRLVDVRLPVVYAALPPGVFGDVARGIAASALPVTTRLVAEKPFGDDARSARQLHDEIVDVLGPERLFIVDHFLAKSAVENMSTARTSNALIANSMCAQYVESIDVVMFETGGVDGRGSFYESVGAVRDVLQNHLLQLLAVLTMEAPADGTDAAFHAALVELLEAVRPFDRSSAILGQYDGYRELDDVADDSTVETFVAATTSIDNARWRDVPVTIRTGKELAQDVTSATITLRPVDGVGGVTNRITFSVKPQSSVSIDLGVLDASSHEPTRRSVTLCEPDGHAGLSDYAVMLDNALDGGRRHFAEIDGVVAAWRVVDPLLTNSTPPVSYAPGTSGPSSDADTT